MKRVKLVDNWKEVAMRSWSIRLIVLAGILSALEVLVPHLPELLGISHGAYSLLSVVVTTAAFIARLLAQKNLHTDGDLFEEDKQ